LRACFITQPSTGPFLVQGFIHFVQPAVFIRLATPMSLSIRTLTCKQVATHERLDSDVLLHTKPLSNRLVFSRPAGRSPLRVFCSSRSSHTSENSYLSPSAHVVSASTFHAPPKRNVSSHRTATPAPFQRKTWMLRCRSFRPARAFRTFLIYFVKEPKPNSEPLVTLHSSAFRPNHKSRRTHGPD